MLSLAALMLVACANPGTPDGGPYDETPPHVVASNPVYASLDSKGKDIKIYFDELVALDNATDKVVVSPPQITPPDITSMGRYIRIKLQDSLKSNTTYTIDFSDAIVDNNEGNPLGNYSFVFSTGKTVDSMAVSGTVVNASNLEPIKGILVGLQSDTADTAFQHKPFIRVARTDSRGHFSIRGVADGTYRVYALQDADGDFIYSQKSEQIAFLPRTIKTGCFPDVRPDTVWRDSTHWDSIRQVHFTHYTPDDIVLRAFTESHSDRHLLKVERNVPEHFDVYFTAPSTELPTVKGLNFNADNAFAIDFNETKDTIRYWAKDTLLAYQDTLAMVLTYLENDSTGNVITTSDTLEVVPRVTHARQQKWADEAYKKWKKEQDKLKKRGLPYLTEQPPTPLEMDQHAVSTLAPNENLSFVMKEPLALVDSNKIHLYLRVDSVAKEASFIFRQDGSSIMKYKLYGEWRPQQQYTLVIDSAAFVGIYGHASAKVDFSFSIPSLDTYSSLLVNLQGVYDTTAVVELLNSSDKPVLTTRSRNGHAEFYFVRPGTYYLRLFFDRNNNGKWDEGDFDTGQEPEETYYYPDKLQLRAKWDETCNWPVFSLPFNRQKPIAITKQKPDKEKKIQNRNAERERNKNK